MRAAVLRSVALCYLHRALLLAVAWPLAAVGQEFNSADSHIDLSGSYPGPAGAPTLHLLQGEKDLLVSFSASWGDGGSHLCYCLGRAEKRGPGQWKVLPPLEGTLQVAQGKLKLVLPRPACCAEDFKGLPIYAVASRKAPQSCKLTTQRAYLDDLEGKATQEEAIRGDSLEVIPAPDDRSDLVVVRLGKRKKLGLLMASDVECAGK